MNNDEVLKYIDKDNVETDAEDCREIQKKEKNLIYRNRPYLY